jgi:hypothetical protein
MCLFDGRQIAAARALTNVGAKELADAAGVTPRTIGRLEVDDAIAIAAKRRHGHVTKSTFDKIMSALAERAASSCFLSAKGTAPVSVGCSRGPSGGYNPRAANSSAAAVYQGWNRWRVRAERRTVKSAHFSGALNSNSLAVRSK